MFFKKKTIAGMVKSGDIKRLRTVLTDQNLNDRDEKGFAPLYYAVKNERSKVAKLLLEMGASLMVSDDEDFSLIEMVVRGCNENMWSVFIDGGCHLPEMIDGEPILHWLVTNKYYAKPLLDVLLATEIDVNRLNKRGETALAYMVGRDFFSMKALDHLLAAGIDVNYASEPDKTPLIVALENRELPCTSIILNFSFKHLLSRLGEYGLDLNTRKRLLTGTSMSPALMAMQAGKPERFIALIDAGIVLTEDDIKQLKGYLTTHHFNEGERKQLIKANEMRGAILPLPVDFYDKSTLTKMLNSMPEGVEVTIEMVRQIAMNGKYTTREKIALISPMLERGVDLNEPIEHAMTDMTLLCAVAGWSDMIKDPKELIQWLLERGAAIEANGYSAFLYAVWFNHRELVTMLADRGADLDFIDRNGMGFESMVITGSPRGDMYATNNDVFGMFTHISDIYKRSNRPFPFDRMVLSGHSIKELTFNRPFICSISMYEGEHQRRFVKLYVDNGWDINRKFDLEYTSGKSINITFFDHLLYSNGVPEQDYIFYLTTYPQIKCGSSDNSAYDSLRMAMFYDCSPEVIEMIIARTENLDRLFTREYDNDDVVESRVENYLALAINYGSCRESAEKVEITIKIVKALINAGCDINFIVKDELTAKYRGGGLWRNESSLLEYVLNKWAGNMSALTLIETLLDNGAPVNTRLGLFEEGFIHFICGRIRKRYYPFVIAVLEILNQRGLLNLEERSNNGATALLHAAGQANVHLTRWLVERGADVMAIGGFDQSTAINRAITNFPELNKADRLETVKVLLDAGADINYVDSDGFTPLMCAVYFGCCDIAAELVERGADINLVNANNNKTLMHMAIDSGDAYDLSEGDKSYTKMESNELRKNIITLLVESGVDIDSPQEGGTTPLSQVIVNGDIDMFKVLSKCGADSNRADLYGRTSAMITCMKGDLGFVNTIFGRRKTMEVIKNVDNDGLNVIHYAARRDVDEKDDMHAMDFIKKFVEYADVPIVADSEGTTPLHYACSGGKSKTATLLIDAGCDINEANNLGNTPLHYATHVTYDTDMSERYEFIKSLVERGADPSVKNSQDYTPAEYARMALDEVDDVDGLNKIIALLEAGYSKIGF